MRVLNLCKKGHFSRVKFPQHQRYQASSWAETLIVREHRDPNRNGHRKKSCSAIVRRRLFGLPSRSNPRSKSLLRINLHPMLPHLMSPLDIKCKGEPLLAATISNFNAGKSSVMLTPIPRKTRHHSFSSSSASIVSTTSESAPKTTTILNAMQRERNC